MRFIAVLNASYYVLLYYYPAMSYVQLAGGNSLVHTRDAGYYQHTMTCVEGTTCTSKVSGTWYTYYGSDYTVYACQGRCKNKCDMIARTDEQWVLKDARWMLAGECKGRLSWGIRADEDGKLVLPGRITVTKGKGRVPGTSGPLGPSYVGHVQVEITNVKLNDSGSIWLGVETEGTDSYARLHIKVRESVKLKPEASISERVEEELMENTPDVWIGKNLDQSIPSRERGLAHTALQKCEGNLACTKAALHVMIYGNDMDCWVCSHHRPEFRAIPASLEDQAEPGNSSRECVIPKNMLQLLAMSRLSWNGSITTEGIDNMTQCTATSANITTTVKVVTVRPVLAPTCLCSNSTEDGSVALGISMCKTNFHFNATDRMCVYNTSGNTSASVFCPWFTETHFPSHAVTWVCGRAARHHLPREWSGCCYPAILYTATIMYPIVLPTEVTSNSRSKRSLEQTRTNLEKIRERYPGYKFKDPWSDQKTTFAYGVGSFTFLAAGVIEEYTLRKLNTLAAEILMLHDAMSDLQMTATLISEEVNQMRAVVLQNREAMDWVYAKEGGVCKMLGSTCCFLIPNSHANISSLIAHSREAVSSIPPPTPPETWFNFDILGGWENWFKTTVLPIIVLILVAVFIIFPMFKCVVNKMVQTVNPESTMQLPQQISQRKPDGNGLEYNDYTDYERINMVEKPEPKLEYNE